MGSWIRTSNFVLLLSLDSSRGRLRNQVDRYLIWLWWVIDLARFEFESGIVLFCFSFIFVSFGETRLLVSWCAGGRCGMACSDEDRGRSRRPGAEDRRWSHRSSTRWPGDREVRWRRARSAPGTWRLEARVSWLSLKTKVVEGFSVWASKPAALVWWFGSQNHRDGFLVWASKPSGFRFVSCATKPTEGGRRGTRVEI
jgi:hypothetical protein